MALFAVHGLWRPAQYASFDSCIILYISERVFLPGCACMQEPPTDDPFDYFGLEADPAHWQASCPELVIKPTVQDWEEQRAWSSDFVCILS